ncbi:hypothetical protein KIS4809_1271 [Bacillus sp. ZZV12-4809]|nr:hypothetical protein KIS4809_1271 [Bacillus sp. ZZV12-4809]
MAEFVPEFGLRKLNFRLLCPKVDQVLTLNPRFPLIVSESLTTPITDF